MKTLLFRLGDWMCEVGERKGIRFLVYNPITWSRFFISARRSGSVFATALKTVYPAVKSAIDIGAGSGGYVARLKQRGYEAEGMEYSSVGRMLARLQGVHLHPFDCSTADGMPALPKADLAFSIEVAEHLPAELAEPFVQYIGSLADFVIFSAAHPGQGGQGHINEQPKEYWRAIFEACGFCFLDDESTRFSEALSAGGIRGWLPTNLQIFRKRA